MWGCEAVGLRGCKGVRLWGCEVVRLRGFQAVRLIGCELIALWGCDVVWICEVVRLRGCQAVSLWDYETVRLWYETMRLWYNTIEAMRLWILSHYSPWFQRIIVNYLLIKLTSLLCTSFSNILLKTESMRWVDSCSCKSQSPSWG